MIFYFDGLPCITFSSYGLTQFYHNKIDLFALINYFPEVTQSRINRFIDGKFF